MDRAPTPHDPTAPAPRAGRGAGTPRGALLVDRELRALCGTQLRSAPGAAAIGAEQIQAASLDLRLGPVAHAIRAGFLPNPKPIEERLRELETSRVSLAGADAVLERGCVYLVPLEEELALDADLRATFNPRSSTGRCDLFTRVLLPGHPRFNETPPGYRGRPWLEIAPLSFPVRVARGDRLAQVRVARGDPSLSREELILEHRREPLCWREGAPVPESEVRFGEDGGIELHLGLAGRDPCGWRAKAGTGALHFAGEGRHAASEFFEPVRAQDGRLVLQPGGFYIFASRERVVIPPHLAAEMVPVDLSLGELRNNYAGFFDNGFGWSPDQEGASRAVKGTAAVLEVRAHDVPFLVEDGQVFFRLRYFRASGIPEKIYAEDRVADSYREQDLSLARAFRSWRTPST